MKRSNRKSSNSPRTKVVDASNPRQSQEEWIEKVWTARELVTLRKRVTQWFGDFSRSLPWRETTDPYRIWLSEIMLQQTQVSTVIPYYEKFLERFPSIIDLANAPIDDVLFLWAGLGYYRRARQLHAAAQRVRDEYDGVFPNTFERVLGLPGIGRYTAGAIMSFAYDQPYPIVEANTQRLYARLIHLQEPTASASGQSKLWSFAEQVLAPTGSRSINHSLMELGSQVCVPKNPRCSECPLAKQCPTLVHGTFEQVPAPKSAKVYTELMEQLVVLRDADGRVLMRKCADGARWSGLWDFLRFDVTTQSAGDSLDAFLNREIKNAYAMSAQLDPPFHRFTYGVTRYRITLDCRFATLAESVRPRMQVAEQRLKERSSEFSSSEIEWMTWDQLKMIGLNSSAQKVVQWLLSRPIFHLG